MTSDTSISGTAKSEASPSISSAAPAAPAVPAHPNFTHLHLHTEYSLLDGGNRIGKLMKHVKSLGMQSVAMTDHGNMFGAYEFYTKAKEEGLKPILGIEAYVALGDRHDRQYTGVADGGFHLVLLAETQEGWQNLLRLTSDSYLNGFYFKPRMDKSTLAQWGKGLIAINGHLGSSIAFHLLKYVNSGEKEEHWRAAVEEAQWHAETFGKNDRGEPCFYIELQRHSVREQQAINPHLIRLARELDLPLVCDNDAHFMRKEDYDAHDTLCCISMGKVKTEENRLRYSTDLYVKGPEVMAGLFEEIPEVIENTHRIAQRCQVELKVGANHAPVVRPIIPEELPKYESGDRTQWFKSFCAGFTLEPFDKTRDKTTTADDLKKQCDEALRVLAEAGLIWRYGEKGVNDEIRARLDRELRILADKSISAYFLIVWDFVNWARQRGIPSLARGSGVGTMVGYVLGLSNACPVKYGLLFERFTDPDRSEYPDIDIDICQDGRSEVIEYVRQKYGHVAQIITFGTLKARAAIKDVGRVLGFSPSETQRLANMVPEALHITLDQAMEQEPELKGEYDHRPEVRQLLDTARALEGQVRHAGVHAAGVVIATQPLETIIPLCRATGANANDGDALTQWDGPTVEKFGLLKMDFLGLRTLSIIERAKKLIRESLSDEAIRRTLGVTEGDRDPLDLDRLTFDDPRVFKLFQRADTAGVFQFESGGMRKLLIDMQPDRLEDLIAANALYRPGPMDLIPAYNRRKHGKERVPVAHEIVNRLTAETYGVMVYQEQVMQICHELGGIPLRSAYTLIKAISKKKENVINAERPVFVEGAAKKGLSKAKAEELFDHILKFAGYGFNKSHSTGYAIVAYQTAYLKTYFPNQYMAAMLTFESQAQKVADWIVYLEDCRHAQFPDGHCGVEVKPPDINLSAADFSVVFGPDEPHDANHGQVRFGLRALKGAGEKAVGAIVEERLKAGPYRSIHEFCERVPLSTVNKATIEALVKAGAFDSVHGMEHRAAMVDAIEPAVKAGLERAADKASGQGSLFGGGGGEDNQAASSSAKATGKSLMNGADVSALLPHTMAWPLQEALMFEKETLGFFVSSHPLEQWKTYLETFGTATTNTLGELAEGTPVVLGGMLARVRPVLVKNGRSAGSKMAMITIEDLVGQVDGVLFSDQYAEFGAMLTDHAMLFLAGEVDRSRNQPNIRISRVIPMENSAAHLAGAVDLHLKPTPQAMVRGDHGNDEDKESAGMLAQVAGDIKRQSKLNGSQGRPVPVRLHVYANRKHVVLEPAGGAFKVAATEEWLNQMRRILGRECVVVQAGELPRTRSSSPDRNEGATGQHRSRTRGVTRTSAAVGMPSENF